MPNEDGTPTAEELAEQSQTPPAPISDPEFDGEFDAERAKRLIAALREDKAKLTGERDEFKTKADEFAASKLSDQERVAKELSDARAELARTRREAALTKHKLPDTALVFLTGESAEDIEAQAVALAALAPVPTPSTAPQTPPDIRTGVTPLLPDGQPSNIPSDKPFDPVAIAASARRRRF